MSLKNKFFSILTVAISVAAFSVFSFGQDSKPTTTTTDKVERHAKGEGREFGKRRHDRDGMDGKHGGGMRHRGMMGMMRGINLTDAQKEQIKAIRLANKPDRSNFEAMRTIMSAKRDGSIT
ncbi:MAG: Spy/CpxP family protein refolding chaperone, partial [Pyrinomonadaceae bacterium]